MGIFERVGVGLLPIGSVLDDRIFHHSKCSQIKTLPQFVNMS